MNRDRNVGVDVESEDWELVSRASRGDRSAYEELYLRHFETVFRSCFSVTRDTNDALDATQEAFCKVFEKLHKLNGSPCNFGGYLFRTSRNVSLKMVLKRKRAISQAEVQPLSGEGPKSYEDPESSLLIDDQRRSVHKAFGRLSGSQSTAISMCDVEGMSYRQISEAMGIKENAVAQLILRARARLRREMRFRSATPGREYTCREVMSELAKGDRALEGQRLLRAHLNGCDNCQASLQDMQEAGVTYRAEIVPVLAAAVLERVFGGSAAAAGPASVGRPLLGKKAYLLISGLSISAMLVALTVPTVLGLFSGNERERGASWAGAVQGTYRGGWAAEGSGVGISTNRIQYDGKTRGLEESTVALSDGTLDRPHATENFAQGRRAAGVRRGAIHEKQVYKSGLKNILPARTVETVNDKLPAAVETDTPIAGPVPRRQANACRGECGAPMVSTTRNTPPDRLSAVKEKQLIPIGQPRPGGSAPQRFTYKKTNS